MQGQLFSWYSLYMGYLMGQILSLTFTWYEYYVIYWEVYEKHLHSKITTANVMNTLDRTLMKV